MTGRAALRLHRFLGVGSLFFGLGRCDDVQGGPEKSWFFFVDQPASLPANPGPPGTSTTDVDLVDVEGDGDLDLFVAEGTDSMALRQNRLLINDGEGRFTDETARQLPALPANSSKADFADLDGDGDLDCLVATIAGELFLANDGSGRFSHEPDRLPPAWPFPSDISADVRSADLDGDGDRDLLVSNENPFNPLPEGGAQDRLWINDGTGHFADETAARLPADTDQTAALLPGDLDGDGDLDLIKLNRGQERVLINDGRAVFADETTARFPTSDDSSRGGALVDLDGDQDLDLVVANSRSQPVALYFNDGRGRFEVGSFGMSPLPDETDAGLALGDLDRDGDLDVYLANAGSFIAGHGFGGGRDRYFSNDGRGRFQERTRAPLHPAVRSQHRRRVRRSGRRRRPRSGGGQLGRKWGRARVLCSSACTAEGVLVGDQLLVSDDLPAAPAEVNVQEHRGRRGPDQKERGQPVFTEDELAHAEQSQVDHHAPGDPVEQVGAAVAYRRHVGGHPGDRPPERRRWGAPDGRR